MKTLKLNAVTFLLVASITHFLPTTSCARALTIVDHGQPRACLILAERPTRAAQLAAFEIQHHLRLITEATVPIRSENEECHGIRILIGESRATRAAGVRTEELQSQEYVVQFRPDSIVIAGRDAPQFEEVVYDMDDPAAIRGLPGFWEEQGTLYAAFDFLEKCCGVRWLNPTDFGTFYPRTKTLKIRGKDIRRRPVFEYRDAIGATGDNPGAYDAYVSLWSGGSEEFKKWDKAAYARLHAKYPQPARYEAARRNLAHLFLLRHRNGGSIQRCNHSLYGYYLRFWEKSKDPVAAQLFVERRPEMFAKGYEGEPPQMCYTSRALIEQLAQDARDYYDGKKTGRDLGIFWQPNLPNLFPVEPMDNSSYCKCEACQQWITRTPQQGRVYSTGTHSDYFFNFVNEVQKELKKTHPDKGLITLAYSSHAAPPSKVKLDPAVAVQFCFACNRSPASGENYENELRLLKAWANDGSGRPLYLWLYYTFPVETARNGKYHCFPGFFAHTIDRQMKLFQKLGYRGMFHCGYGQDVEAYVTFKLMDDPGRNIEKLLDEYFTGLYGKAARPMKELYVAMEKVYCDPRNYPRERVSGAQLSWGYLGTAERMARFERLLNEARTLATSEWEKRNIELFELSTWSYMQAGRNKFVERQKAPIPSVKAPRLPDASGVINYVQWEKAASLSEPWFDRGGAEPSVRKLEGRVAHDGKYLYLELTDHCDTSKLVSSAMVFPYDDWEIFIAAQRAVPYRQYAVSPSGLIVALAHGEINFRMNVPIEDHGVKAVSDTSDPHKWVTRMAIPLQQAIPGGVKPGEKAFINILRVTGPALTGTGSLGIDSWVSYCTVHEVDRLAEVTLEK